MAAPGPVLFDFIAGCLVKAGVAKGDHVGFTFSFPVNQTAVDQGSLIAWTKGEHWQQQRHWQQRHWQQR